MDNLSISKSFLILHLLQMWIMLSYGSPIATGSLESAGSLGSVASASVSGSEVVRLKRQRLRSWTATSFSECSVTCGGGLRVRSVRCLDEDGVISGDCSTNNRPFSYEFCNQIDCETNNSNSSLFPPSDTYFFTNNDGSSAMLQFVDRGENNFNFLLTTTESDNTMTLVDEAISNGIIQGVSRIFRADINITFMESVLQVNGDNILDLNGVEQTNISNTQRITYQNDKISIPNEETLAERISMFFYYDGFRIYQFNTSKINPLLGPGMLYYNRATGMAVYSIDEDFNAQVNAAIDSLTDTTTVVIATITVTSANALTTDQVFSSPGPSTIAPETNAPTTDQVLPSTGPSTIAPETNAPTTDQVLPSTGPSTIAPETNAPTTDQVLPSTGPPTIAPETNVPTTDQVFSSTGPPSETVAPTTTTNSVPSTVFTTSTIAPSTTTAISKSTFILPTTKPRPIPLQHIFNILISRIPRPTINVKCVTCVSVKGIGGTSKPARSRDRSRGRSSKGHSKKKCDKTNSSKIPRSKMNKNFNRKKNRSGKNARSCSGHSKKKCDKKRNSKIAMNKKFNRKKN